MDLSPGATKAALTAFMYAYLLEAGADAKIPDFSSSFGYRLSDGDKAALLPLYETAQWHASHAEAIRKAPVPVRIYGHDYLPS